MKLKRNGLTELKAEEAGLWAIAVRTVVMLVSFSCQQHTVDLVKDFEAAGGFKVLRYELFMQPMPDIYN